MIPSHRHHLDHGQDGDNIQSDWTGGSEGVLKYREMQSLIPKKLKYILEIQYLKYKLTIHSDTFKIK